MIKKTFFSFGVLSAIILTGCGGSQINIHDSAISGPGSENEIQNGLIRGLRNIDQKVLSTYTADYGKYNYIGMASPGVIRLNGQDYFYFRGENADGAGKFQSSLPYLHRAGNNKEWDNISGPLFFSEYDGGNILNPSPVVYKNKVYMFYNDMKKGTVSYAKLAISEDGIHFDLDGRLKNGEGFFTYASSVSPYVKNDEIIYLVFRGDRLGYDNDFCITYSTDDCKTWSDPVVFFDHGRAGWMQDDTGSYGQLDTCELFEYGDYIYMIYGDTFFGKDYPEGLGIARVFKNADITKGDNWEVYPYNPVLIRGATGSPDEGAMWAPAAYEDEDGLYLFYEGCGSGTNSQSDSSVDLSEIIKHSGAYPLFRFKNFSNIMFCKLNTDDLEASWDLDPVTGSVKIQNVSSGNYMDLSGGYLTESPSGTIFDLSFENNFFHIRDGENELMPEQKTDGSDYVTFDAGPSAGLLCTDEEPPFDHSKMGMEWQLYPENGTYKIQNRWTGCFINSAGNGLIGQSLETNNDTMKWNIIQL